ARMGVARELAVAVQATKEEAEDDLPQAVALLARTALELLEAHTLDVVAHQHPLPRERGDDLRHHDEGMAREDARERTLVLRLELVVQLLDDPLTDLLGDRLHIEARGHALEQAHDQVEVLQVGADRS